MSAPITEPSPTTPVEAEAPITLPEGAEPKTFDAEYVAKLRAENAKHRTEAKANADAAKRLAEIEEAAKSNEQKLAERLTAAEKRAADAERASFAAEKGVPASFIHGSTPEEWEASAAEALTWKGVTPKLPVAPSADGQGRVGVPVSAGAAQLSKDDVSKLYAEKKYDEIEKARIEGRLASILGPRT